MHLVYHYEVRAYGLTQVYLCGVVSTYFYVIENATGHMLCVVRAYLSRDKAFLG